MIPVEWEALKEFSDRRTVPIEFLEDDQKYTVFITFDGSAFYTIIIKMNPKSPEQQDFEDNFKEL